MRSGLPLEEEEDEDEEESVPIVKPRRRRRGGVERFGNGGWGCRLGVVLGGPATGPLLGAVGGFMHQRTWHGGRRANWGVWSCWGARW